MRAALNSRSFCIAAAAIVAVATSVAVAQDSQQKKGTTEDQPQGTPASQPPGPAAGVGGAGSGRGPTVKGGGIRLSTSAPKSKLEEMLEKALKNNPDLRVAAAKVQEAEAELNRTRLEVTRKVVRQYALLEAARTNVEGTEKRLAEIRKLAEKGRVSREEVQAAEKELAVAKTDLAAAESELPYLVGEQSISIGFSGSISADGKSGSATTSHASLGAVLSASPPQSGAAIGGWGALGGQIGAIPGGALGGGGWGALGAPGVGALGGGGWGALGAVGVGALGGGLGVGGGSPANAVAKAPSAEMASRIREALDRKFVELQEGDVRQEDYKNAPLSKVLKDIEIDFGLMFIVRLPGPEPKVTLRLKDQSLGAALQAIADQTRLEFIVRDYGILVLDPKADELPADALRVHDFWKTPRAASPPATKKGSEKPPSK